MAARIFVYAAGAAVVAWWFLNRNGAAATGSLTGTRVDAMRELEQRMGLNTGRTTGDPFTGL